MTARFFIPIKTEFMINLRYFKISNRIIVRLNYFIIYVFYDCDAMGFVNKVGFLLVLVMSLYDSIDCAAGQGNPKDFGKGNQNSNPNRVSKVSASSQNYDTSSGAGPLTFDMAKLQISSPGLKAAVSANVFGAIEQETLDDAEFRTIKTPDSQSSGSHGKKRKTEDSPSKVNQRLVEQINQKLNQGLTPSQPKRDIKNLRTRDVPFINALSPNSFDFVSKKIKVLKDCNDNVKTGIAEALAVKTVHSILGSEVDSEVDSIARNNKLIPAYETKSNTLSLINGSNVDISDSVMAYVSAVDTQHPMVLREKKDKSGKLVNIAGAHISQCYKKAGGCLYKLKGLLGLDENVMGIETLEGNIGKTVYKDASAETFILNLKNSKLIAKDESQSGMNISELPSGEFVGSYKHRDNKLYSTTQFPILTATDTNLDEHENIAIGYLVNFRRNGDVDNTSKTKISISQSDFDVIMNDPAIKSFVAQSGTGLVVKDITQSLERCCSEQLTAFGMEKFTVPIYGVKKIN